MFRFDCKQLIKEAIKIYNLISGAEIRPSQPLNIIILIKLIEFKINLAYLTKLGPQDAQNEIVKLKA